MADPIPFEQLPFRLKVLSRITEQLQGITRDMPGALPCYSYSLAPDETFPDGRVLRGRGTYGTNDPLPMICIIEDPKQAEQDAVPEQSDAAPGSWDILIQGFIKDDPVHPTDPAYFLLADTKAKLHQAKAEKRNILGLGYKQPSVEELHIGAGVVRPADDLSVTTYFWLPVRLKLVEDAADAFT